MSSLDATLALSFDHGAPVTPHWAVASYPAASASSLVVADPYHRPSFRIHRFARFCTSAFFTPTHVQWFTPRIRGFLSLQLRFQGVSKGVCYVPAANVSGSKCWVAFAYSRGIHPIPSLHALRKPQELLQAPDRVWCNRSERGRADRLRCGLILRAMPRITHSESALYRLRQLLGARDARTHGGRQGQPEPGSVVGRHVAVRGGAAASHDPKVNDIEKIGRLRTPLSRAFPPARDRKALGLEGAPGVA